MKHTIFFIFLTISILVQQTGSAQNIKSAEYQELFKPDSLLTQEQIAFKVKVVKFLSENIAEKADTLCCAASKADFSKNHIPECYYDELTSNLVNVNKLIREKNLPAKEIIAQIKAIYLKHAPTDSSLLPARER